MPAKALWHENKSLYDLMVLKATMGDAAFESEYQSNPVDPSLCEWPDKLFTHGGFWFDEWPKHLVIKTMGLDPSKGSEAKHGDYSAIVKLGRDATGMLYCEADLSNTRGAEEIVDTTVAAAKTFIPEAVAIETNAFQELFLILFAAADKAAQWLTPVYAIQNNINKMVRIRRLGPYLVQKQIRFKARSPGTSLLVQQLRDFPNGSTDDGGDALEFCLRVMIELWNAKQGGQAPTVLRTQ